VQEGERLVLLDGSKSIDPFDFGFPDMTLSRTYRYQGELANELASWPSDWLTF